MYVHHDNHSRVCSSLVSSLIYLIYSFFCSYKPLVYHLFTTWLILLCPITQVFCFGEYRIGVIQILWVFLKSGPTSFNPGRPSWSPDELSWDIHYCVQPLSLLGQRWVSRKGKRWGCSWGNINSRREIGCRCIRSKTIRQISHKIWLLEQRFVDGSENR